jgi:hypothetical protein
MNWLGSVMSGAMSATPIEMVTGMRWSSKMKEWSATILSSLSAKMRDFSGPLSGSTIANSSPP